MLTALILVLFGGIAARDEYHRRYSKKSYKKNSKRSYRSSNYSKRLYEDGGWFYDHGRF